MSAPEQENDWENDPVWDLVDQAQAPEANPLFVRNIMREVRLSSETRRPWWKPLLAPRPILVGSLAAMAVALLIAVGPEQPDQVRRTIPIPAKCWSHRFRNWMLFLRRRCSPRLPRTLPPSATRLW